MRILFVADGRSPTALNWMRYWVERSDQVFLASTFDCDPGLALAGYAFVPVAFSAAKRQPTSAPESKGLLWGARTLGLRAAVRQWLGPLTLTQAAQRLQEVIAGFKPDLVHALRIPYEGMLAARADPLPPLLVSVWGNDFTLHARSTPLMARETRRALQRADALLADCQRDIRLAHRLGFPQDRPTLVVPGNGGVRAEVFHPAPQPAESPLVINPRGFRKYVRNDTFFQSIPLVLKEKPGTRFLCPGMAGEPQVEAWVKQLGIQAAVELIPPQPHPLMAAFYRSAQVLVSPSTHDGTPNSLLEGMASGCFPVTGDLESIREWITPGENGLLVDPSDPQALATAILTGLDQPALRARAAEMNAGLIAERAEYTRSMARVGEFYAEVIRRNKKL